MKFVYSLKEWKAFVSSAFRNVIVGLFRLVWSIVIAMTSVVHYVVKSVKDFVGREFRASLIVFSIIFLMLIGWLTTFVSERSKCVRAEMQRDSLSLKLDSARQNARIYDYAD